jgi:CRP-like cAMP-binding protein
VASPFKDFTIHLQAGETVYQEGEPGTMMYVIQSGAVELVREIEGRKISFGVLEKGDFFGEMSLLLESQPRTTHALVVEDADLVEINATLFDKMIRGNIEIAVRMMRKISLRLRELEERLHAELPAAIVAAAPPPLPAPGPRPAPPPPSASPQATEAPAPANLAAPAVAASPAPRARPSGAPPAPKRVAGAHAMFASSDGRHQFPLLSDRAAIGRFDPVTGMRPEVDLSALDINRSVSRHHARLVHEGDGYALTEEVGALNGTYVSGKRLTTGKPARLHHGDEVSFGMVKLMFQVLGSS